MMKFDITKPLGEDLEEYMEADIKNICFELHTQGIVNENQFQTLGAMVCKKNASELAKLFSKKTKRCIWYMYDNITYTFSFYDMDMYSQDKDEVLRKSRNYQKL